MKRTLLILAVITCGMMMSCNPTCDCEHTCDHVCDCGDNCGNNEPDPGENSTTINGYEYVDLGLPSGIKWATHNVGATTPEDYGEYYAWGMTTTPVDGNYNEANCVTFEKPLSDISGNSQYDVARAKWGSTWRMPTRTELQEIHNKCTWEAVVQNGVAGCKVTGPNGNHIFMPLAGYYSESTLNHVEYCGYYWSSNNYNDTHKYASDIDVDDDGSKHLNYGTRYHGQSIRPVSD